MFLIVFCLEGDMDMISKSVGPLVVLAGAGTGKTRAIVEKVKNRECCTY